MRAYNPQQPRANPSQLLRAFWSQLTTEEIIAEKEKLAKPKADKV
jgi:hypothetical protein